MTRSLHESFERVERIEHPSERAFGLTVGGILALIVAWRGWGAQLGVLEIGLAAVGIGLIGCALLCPRVLDWPNRAWMRFGFLLGAVVSPVVLFLIYATTVVPVGLLRRALGHDSLRLSFDADAGSYWLAKESPGPKPETMRNQF